jgi:hypothetical protein
MSGRPEVAKQLMARVTEAGGECDDAEPQHLEQARRSFLALPLFLEPLDGWLDLGKLLCLPLDLPREDSLLLPKIVYRTVKIAAAFGRFIVLALPCIGQRPDDCFQLAD